MLELLGIHWGQFPDEHEIRKREKQSFVSDQLAAQITCGFYVKGLSGMTCVAPASAIWELLDMLKLKQIRKEADDALADEIERRPRTKRDFNRLLGAAEAITRPGMQDANLRQQVGG
jgi:hypothetical protein